MWTHRARSAIFGTGKSQPIDHNPSEGLPMNMQGKRCNKTSRFPDGHRSLDISWTFTEEENVEFHKGKQQNKPDTFAPLNPIPDLSPCGCRAEDFNNLCATE